MDSFGLTQQQIEHFNKNGFLKLEQCIGTELLILLQQATNEWIEKALSNDAQGKQVNNTAIVPGKQNTRCVLRINNIHEIGHTVTFELLQHPEIIGAVQSICGVNVITEYESLLVKQEADEQVIPWHQDVVYNRDFRVVTVGVYLDDSTPENGCLKIVPGTQYQKHDICALAQKHGFDSSDIMNVCAMPGDVIIHDAMIVHASDKSRSTNNRRTLYFEFRSVEHIRQEGYRTQNWIKNREHLHQLATEYTTRPINSGTDSEDEIIRDIQQYYLSAQPGQPGNFCLGEYM